MSSRPTEWSAIPRAGDRVWGPDLFAWAYDHLELTQGWRGRAQPEDIEHEGRVLGWREDIRAAKGWIPDDLLHEIQSAISGMTDEDEGLLQLVLAIDRAYIGIRLNSPRSAINVDALVELADEWEAKGSLERAADGLVLRKGAQWRAGSALSHYCNDLSRVPPHLHGRVVVLPYTPSSSLGSLLRDQGAAAELTVAFVPTLDAIEAVRFTRVDRGRSRLFTIELDARTQRAVADGMEDLIRRLEANGVNVALFPETVAVPELGQALRLSMLKNNERCLGNGTLPELRLAVIGLAGDRMNSALVIGADGATLLTQPKTQRWLLDRDQQKRYGLVRELEDVDRYEDINEGAVLTFLDDPGFGRVAVLICEDLARGDPAWQLTTAATPSVILSPVFDGSLRKRRWAFVAATRVASEPGALVFVANSFVLAQRERAAAGAGDGSPLGSAGIGIVCHPTDRGQTRIVTAAPRSGSFHRRTITWPQAWS